MADETPTPRIPPESAGPAEPSVPASSFDLAALQRDLRIATRSGRYALVTAVAAAVISAGISAWASTSVSNSEMNRQEHFTAAQAVRKDRREVYTQYVTSFMDLDGQLTTISAALNAHPPDRAAIAAEMNKLPQFMQSHLRAEAAVRIVGSEMGPLLARRDRALTAMQSDPGSSLAVVRSYLDDHPGALTDDDEWRRVATVGITAIQKLLNDTSIDEIAERARADLGSG